MSCLLETERLLLRLPEAADISHFVPLLQDFEVAKNLSRAPHPYTEDDACAFITHAARGWRTGEDLAFAILRKKGSAYIGACGLHPSRDWEFGYWLGKAFWGQGYATEAGARAVAYAFEERGADRLNACWYTDNPASGRVLEKLGFKRSGNASRACMARGTCVEAYSVTLDRAAYETRKKVS